MKSRHRRHFLLLAAVLAAAAPELGAQALEVAPLAHGGTLVVVAEPNATATTVAWPEADADGVRVAAVSGGELTLAAELADALRDHPAPPLVVAVGGAAVGELQEALKQVVGSSPPAALPVQSVPVEEAEGGVERRLGAPGEGALLQLRLPLPPAADWRRPAVEVLAEALPALLARELPGLRVRMDEGEVRLELAVDPELGEMQLGRLRVALARLGSSPQLPAEPLAAARERLEVRREVLLERHPDAAVALVRLWRAGDVPAVRRFLFGLTAVTPELAGEAARQWLPAHPGTAVLRLPPRVFSPRFAPGPRAVALGDDLVARVLERPASAVAAVCLEPVLVPDLDGALTATLLARVASALRADPSAPAWVDVASDPARLELAGPVEAPGDLLEVLGQALATSATDPTTVPVDAGDPRRQALALAAGLLGVGGEVSASSVLRPDNLAVGVVTSDGDSATEALGKFLGDLPAAGVAPQGRALAGERRRQVVAGNGSAVALVLDVTGRDAGVRRVLAALLAARGEALLPERHVEVLAPVVPGRNVLVVLVTGSGTVAELEGAVRAAWKRWRRPVVEDDLAPLRRRVAAAAATASSGAVGQAATAAAVAAGVEEWRPATDLQLALLGVEADAVSAALAALPAVDGLETVAAGPLPAAALPHPG